MFPKVVQVIPMRDYSVYVYFEDGKIVHYDMSHMLEKEDFAGLKDVELFMDRCTVMNDTLAWDISGNWDNTTCLDIDPDTLYAIGLEEHKNKTTNSIKGRKYPTCHTGR